MTSSWLASFVLIVVFLGVMAVISGGVWVLFLFLSRWERRGERRLGRERDPAQPCAVPPPPDGHGQHEVIQLAVGRTATGARPCGRDGGREPQARSQPSSGRALSLPTQLVECESRG
jgi:hypothetical protein